MRGMTSPAAAAILDGMPDPRDLRRSEHGGLTWVTAGPVTLACYPPGDIAMRNVAVAVARQLGFGGRVVAEVMGLSEAYVATLRQRALKHGAAGLVRPSGPKPKLGPADWARARGWREAGAAAQPAARPEPSPGPVPGPGSAGTGPRTAGPRITGGSFESRYAGAMLLHAFGAQAGAGAVLAAAAGDAGPGGRRFADVALLSATSICFGLGAATTEQFKHLTAAAAGPLAGLAVLPDLRTLRPRLAAIAGRTDPLELQAMFARAMLAADPVLSGVYYVDDHFVPYTGAKPVGKGWNNKRGRAERGRADTHVTAHDGRAVCFVTGEPSGLTATLPLALAELRKAAGPGAPVMLGFDRGGAFPQVFRHCREQDVHWVTYRRAPLAVPAGLPVIATVTVNGRTRQVAWAEEIVQ